MSSWAAGSSSVPPGGGRSEWVDRDTCISDLSVKLDKGCENCGGCAPLHIFTVAFDFCKRYCFTKVHCDGELKQVCGMKAVLRFKELFLHFYLKGRFLQRKREGKKKATP